MEDLYTHTRAQRPHIHGTTTLGNYKTQEQMVAGQALALHEEHGAKDLGYDFLQDWF